MCPSMEGSLRELVQQVTFDENLNRSGSENDKANLNGTAFGLSTQLKLGTRLSELQDSIKHIFEGQA